VLISFLVAGLAASIKYILNQSGFAGFQGVQTLSILISAGIFISAFMLNGVLVDYKDAEKTVSDIEASFRSILSVCASVGMRPGKKSISDQLLNRTEDLMNTVFAYFTKEISYRDMSSRCVIQEARILSLLYEAGAEIRTVLPSIHVITSRVSRAEQISSTHYISAGYLLMDSVLLSCILALLTSRYDSNESAYIFVFLLSFLLTFINVLIRILEDPLEYDSTALNPQSGHVYSWRVFKNPSAINMNLLFKLPLLISNLRSSSSSSETSSPLIFVNTT
jgi:hypothetical protein